MTTPKSAGIESESLDFLLHLIPGYRVKEQRSKFDVNYVVRIHSNLFNSQSLLLVEHGKHTSKQMSIYHCWSQIINATPRPSNFITNQHLISCTCRQTASRGFQMMQRVPRPGPWCWLLNDINKDLIAWTTLSPPAAIDVDLL